MQPKIKEWVDRYRFVQGDDSEASDLTAPLICSRPCSQYRLSRLLMVLGVVVWSIPSASLKQKIVVC
jgi:hypothetical protein